MQNNAEYEISRRRKRFLEELMELECKDLLNAARERLRGEHGAWCAHKSGLCTCGHNALRDAVNALNVPVEPSPKAAALDLDAFANAINNASQEASDEWNMMRAAASTSVDAPECPRCDGEGKSLRFSEQAWDFDEPICPICKGTGKAPAERVKPRHDRKTLLDVKDGPEGIHIYTSEEDAIVDFSEDIPGLYIDVAINGACSKFGPFTLRSIREGVEKALVRELPTAPLDDAGLDWLIDTFFTSDDDGCGFNSYHSSMKAVLREYAAMGDPEVGK